MCVLFGEAHKSTRGIFVLVTASAEAACVYIDQITDQHMLPDESLNALTLAP